MNIRKKIPLEEVIKKITEVPGDKWKYKTDYAEEGSGARGSQHARHTYTFSTGGVKIEVSMLVGSRWSPTDYSEYESSEFENYFIDLCINSDPVVSYSNNRRIRPIYKKVERLVRNLQKAKEKRDEDLKRGKLEKFLKGDH